MQALLNIAVVFSLLLLTNCTPSKNASAKKNEADLKPVALKLDNSGGTNKIVFLTMSISVKDSVKDEYELRQSDVKYATGAMKSAKADMANAEPQYLYCEISNAEKEQLDVIRVDNPLYRVYEFSEEGSSTLQKKTFTAKTGEFVVRFNLNKQTSYLSVYKLSANNLKKIYYAQL